jgi:ribosomal protein S18 acetylase RimI-like enzyme
MTIARPALDIRCVKVHQLGDDRAPLADFCCGEAQIDGWAAKCHDYERGHKARAFCAMQQPCALAYGFYSLSLRGEHAKGMQDAFLKAHNNAGTVPFVYIDNLGVQTEYQRQRLGTFLLIDALARCHRIALNVGFCGVALHSLNERTTKLYTKYDFVVAKPDLRNSNPLMVLPVQKLFDLFGPVSEATVNGQKKTYVYPQIGP